MGYFKILIKNGRVFDGVDFLGKKDVLISGGKIEKINDSINENANFVFDVNGKIVAPGLIDIHTHIYGVSNSNIGTPAESVCFPFGVTTVCDGCAELNDESFLKSLKTKIGVFVPAWVKKGELDLKTTSEILNKYGDFAVGVKAYFDEKVADNTNILHLKEICDYAQSRNIKVMVHCSNSPTGMKEIVNILNKGDILTHIFHGGENNICLFNDYAAFKLAREKGVILDSGFAGHVHTDFSVLEKAMADGWFPDTISTDITNLSAFIRGGRYGLTLCMSLCRHFGMREEDVLKAVTYSAAKAIGMPHLGRIREGAVADIAVISYGKNPFDFSRFVKNGAKDELGYKCHLTLSDGQVVWRDF